MTIKLTPGFQNNEQHIEQQERVTIDITPVGLKTPEGIERVTKAQQAWDNSHAAVANALTRLYEDLRMQGYIPKENYGEEIEEIDALIERRAEAQEEFLRSLAGAPPRA